MITIIQRISEISLCLIEQFKKELNYEITSLYSLENSEEDINEYAEKFIQKLALITIIKENLLKQLEEIELK
jgi:hypothetical protein